VCVGKFNVILMGVVMEHKTDFMWKNFDTKNFSFGNTVLET
jgi:hypothetical protein